MAGTILDRFAAACGAGKCDRRSHQAVQTGQSGDFVFVVTADMTAESRPVKVARTLGEESVISQGMTPGETVVTDGQLRADSRNQSQVQRQSAGQLERTLHEYRRAIFIRRPIMTTLVMMAILLFGIIAYRSLAVSDLPNVDYPTIQVPASLPGANPDTMASAVATPLEKQFSTIAGIDSMTSSSSLGTTQITLQFDLSRNIDGAAQDVQAAIARAAPQLPPNMPTPPTYNKVNPADQPILYLAMGSKTLPLYVVDQYAETLMGQRISMVKGVAQVEVYGSQKYAVRIQLDPQALATRQIGIDEVHAAVQNANVNMPVGTLYGEHRAFTLQATGS